MRIIIDGFGRRLADIELFQPLRKPGAVPPPPAAPGYDPHGTTGGQVEQAAEPAPGFGFAGSTKTVVVREKQ